MSAEAAKFDIDERTGQIRTKAGMTYNYEDIDGGDLRPAY